MRNSIIQYQSEWYTDYNMLFTQKKYITFGLLFQFSYYFISIKDLPEIVFDQKI